MVKSVNACRTCFDNLLACHPPFDASHQPVFEYRCHFTPENIQISSTLNALLRMHHLQKGSPKDGILLCRKLRHLPASAIRAGGRPGKEAQVGAGPDLTHEGGGAPFLRATGRWLLPADS